MYIWRLLEYVQIVLCLLGIIGNAISVYVLSVMNSKPLRLLKYLCVVDIVLLAMVCTLLTEGAFMSEGLKFTVLLQIVFLCIGTLVLIVQTFEAYLTVLIAIVRCLAVAMPFRFATCMRDSVQNKLLIANAVFSVLFNVPLILPLMTREASSIRWISDVSIYLQPIFCRFLPILIIVGCNVILVVSRCRLKSLEGQDNQCSSSNGRHSRSAFQLTCLVLAITAMFIVTHGSFGVVAVYVWVYPRSIMAVHFLDFFSWMTIINSATNFVFYCSVGSEFRTTLVSLCKEKSCSAGRNRSVPMSPV